MANRTVERTDGVTTERETVNDGAGVTVIERRSGGGAGLIIGIGVLALVALIAFFFVTQSRNDAIRTDAVTEAASSVADSASNAAENVSGAAERAADSVTPDK